MFMARQDVHFEVTHPDTNPAQQGLTSVQICLGGARKGEND